MPKQSVTMRLDKNLLKEAKKYLGTKQTTATVETALRNIVNNRQVIDFFKKYSGKSKWEGFDKDGNVIW